MRIQDFIFTNAKVNCELELEKVTVLTARDINTYKSALEAILKNKFKPSLLPVQIRTPLIRINNWYCETNRKDCHYPYFAMMGIIAAINAKITFLENITDEQARQVFQASQYILRKTPTILLKGKCIPANSIVTGPVDTKYPVDRSSTPELLDMKETIQRLTAPKA